jgi:protein phosphatase
VDSPLARVRHRAPRVVDCAALAHVGYVREHNEDAHAALPDRGVFLVADGMGGHVGGEVASAIAVSTARASLLARTGRQP